MADDKSYNSQNNTNNQLDVSNMSTNNTQQQQKQNIMMSTSIGDMSASTNSNNNVNSSNNNQQVGNQMNISQHLDQQQVDSSPISTQINKMLKKTRKDTEKKMLLNDEDFN